VVVRYAEWLDRTGENGQRRLYVYPMAADGAEDSLPHVEELKVTFDLSRAGARDVRVGMAGVRSGDALIVRAHDFVPRADLSLELLDAGVSEQRAYRAKHLVDLEALPPSARNSAAVKADGEADYLLVPVRPGAAKLPAGGLDGMALLGDVLLVSSWKGSAIYRGSLAGKFEAAFAGLSGAADFGVDPKRKRILVPRFVDNAIEVYDLK
jgi:Ca-activated chloride channel family protein